MNDEILSITRHIRQITTANPWYGRPAYEIMEEINPSAASVKPGKQGHSMLELLYHMNTWTEFTLRRIQGNKEQDLAAFERLDWRKIDPAIHTWQKALAEFKTAHADIIRLLEQKDDSFLDKKVDYREYDFRFLLNGFIEHTIYHLGQIAYIHKFLV